MQRSTTSKACPRPSRRTAFRFGVIATLVFAIFALNRYRRDAPRRESLAVISAVELALTSSHAEKTLPLIELPPSAAAKSPGEKARWIADVLRDEVSAAGLAEIRRHARFGPLAEVFPDEAKR